MQRTPIIHLLAPEDQAQLRRGAKAAHAVEAAYTRKFDALFDALEQDVWQAMDDGRDPPELDLTTPLLENAYAAANAAIQTQPRLPARMAKTPPKPRAGQAPAMQIPSNPRQLREWWDRVRKGKAPRRIQALADRIKAEYIRTVQRLWVEHAEAFRQGDQWTQDYAKAQVRKAVAVARNRARTIVATETTRYYNQVRRSAYDENDAITHYLYVAVRDHRTTKWCKPGIGRDGIVYTKGTAILERETPPTHYQCRSELLPLSPFNPNHMRLINDQTRRRENRHPAPLLPGWNT